MNVHLIDGTYELFRHFYGAPSRLARDGAQVGAVVGLLRSLLSLLGRPAVTHLACAFDHVIESFRNDLYSGYKTGEGIDPDLWAQFPLAEQAVEALGVVVWPMVEFEADDALAAGAARFEPDPAVDCVFLCSPDKDLAQCVVDGRVVQWDRRRDLVLDERAVTGKYGVSPASIPDWLALVGDSADGYPGIPGWGAKSAAAVLERFVRLENIPTSTESWGLPRARAERLSESLRTRWDEALLYRHLATLRRDVPLPQSLADLEWRGARQALRLMCSEWDVDDLPERIDRWIPA